MNDFADPDAAMVGVVMGAGTSPQVDPTLFGRPLDEIAAQQRGEPLPAPAEEAPQVQEDFTPREFDPKHKEPFTGLLFVGALTDEFELWGHRFVIATPTQTERMQIGPVIKDYADTIAGEMAYATALVAAYLVSVDGHELPKPVVKDIKETALRDRFRWVSDTLQKPVIDYVFSKCLELDQQVDDVLEAMGKA